MSVVHNGLLKGIKPNLPENLFKFPAKLHCCCQSRTNSESVVTHRVASHFAD